MRIEKRRRLYYAVMSVPRPLRPAVGKDRYVQSLQTSDRATAERHAALLQHQWLTQLAKVNKATADPLAQDAAFWRRLIKDAPDEDQRELLKDLLADEAQARVDRAATRQGITDDKDTRYQELPELQEAMRFVQVATGQLLPTDEHLEDWRGTLLQDTQKTAAGKVSAVREFSEAFPFTQDVNRRGVQGWVNKLSAAGIAPPTLSRKLQKVRGYWSYLISLQAVSEATAAHFEKLSMPRGSAPRGSNGRPVREAFTATEVVQLLAMAEQREDAALVDLIRLGMFTGARIEELCSLKINDMRGDHFEIVDAKSPAGCRTVPIHSQLEPIIERLVREAGGRHSDPYIIGGQAPDQFGIRSGALGKRFGRLRKAAGHGPERVFHSIRKTVATLLENVGVPEGIAADILGHEKRTLSYGLYSSGSSMQRKIEAIEKLVYPGASL